MTDYTLPPLPEHNGWNNEVGKPYWFAVFVLQHGQACAEAARAPLLAANAALSARIAELEGQLTLAQADGPDAKRYRWLRECDDGADRELHTTCRSELLSGAALDDAVDRLMKENGDA